MSRPEKENVLSHLPPKEQRFIKDGPSYNRDGLIPGWADVVVEFGLDKFHPRDFRLLRGYYRAQRKVAEKAPKKAGKIFRALDKNPFFQRLEEEEGQLLTHIASFIRGPSEKKRLR